MVTLLPDSSGVPNGSAPSYLYQSRTTAFFFLIQASYTCFPLPVPTNVVGGLRISASLEVSDNVGLVTVLRGNWICDGLPSIKSSDAFILDFNWFIKPILCCWPLRDISPFLIFLESNLVSWGRAASLFRRS